VGFFQRPRQRTTNQSYADDAQPLNQFASSLDPMHIYAGQAANTLCKAFRNRSFSAGSPTLMRK
jgi:hypothetical protein